MSQAEVFARPPAAGPPASPLALPLTDWTLRPFLATGISPLWVGLGLAIAVTAVSQLYRLAFGASLPGRWFFADTYFWLDLLNGVLLAYVPTALTYLRRGRLRDLQELRPALDCDDAEYLRLAEQALCPPRRRLAASGLAGGILLGMAPIIDPGFWEGPRPPITDPLMLLFVVRSAATGWLGGHAFASELTATLAFLRVGARHLRVDLLDLGALAPFARASQRGAFAWVLISSLVSLFWLGPAAGAANVVILAAILALVSVSFFLSIYGVHRSLVAAKREALASLQAQIRSRGGALVAGREATGEGPRLADLVAYHGFLERVREWPLGTPALLRGALIAALALGSWLGGALVDQLLERALG